MVLYDGKLYAKDTHFQSMSKSMENTSEGSEISIRTREELIRMTQQNRVAV